MKNYMIQGREIQVQENDVLGYFTKIQGSIYKSNNEYELLQRINNMSLSSEYYFKGQWETMSF